MQPGLQVILSGCLTFGIPLAFALRELSIMRRSQGDNWQPPPPPPEEPPKPKPLPPCLLVHFQPQPPARTRTEPRVLERV